MGDPNGANIVALSEVGRWVGGELIGSDVQVTDIAYDSRVVESGALFICVVGFDGVDGHDFARAAVEAGAGALVVERRLEIDVPQVLVADTRRAMAPIAAGFFGNPAEAMDIVGITGTNGKTTVSHLVVTICEAAGRSAATIGTLSGTRTTPEAPDLHRHLARLRAHATDVVALEVSSQALAVHRADALVVDVAVFTNLSRDHLDLHGSMDAYFQAKALLFTPEHARQAAVNLDDPYGRLLSDAAQVPTVGYSRSDATDVVVDGAGSTFTWRGQRVSLPLTGSVNVVNALAAATATSLLGIDDATIVAGLSEVAPVAGRFELVDLAGPFGVSAPFRAMVDYAHTPDALEQLLVVAKELVGSGRVHLVFGCGGDKDTGKRAAMGEVAANGADHVVVTSDNPRSESPEAIIAEIRRGMSTSSHVQEPDRRRAIALALRSAAPGDLVVVAGKGHETVQIIGDSRIPFVDHVVVREEYERLVGTSG